MKGVLLVNLGSPESPSPKDVKTYLGEFLMDERVVDLPKLFRTILVKGIILNTRPKQSIKNRSIDLRCLPLQKNYLKNYNQGLNHN